MPLGADFAHSILEIVTRNGGLILHARAVIIYGIYRVAQQRGDARRVGNAEFDEGENSKLRIEHSGIFEHKLHILFQQRVELLNEGGVEAQKGIVEVGIKLLLGILDNRGAFNLAFERVDGALRESLAHVIVVGFQQVDIVGADDKE